MTGQRTDYPKRDLYVRPKGDPKAPWRYAASTTWARTNAEAVARYQPDHGTFEVKAVKVTPTNRKWDR